MVALVWGFAAVTTGCDECTVDAMECDGDVQRRCADEGEGLFHAPSWVDRRCPVACRESFGYAQCVDSRDPVPECAGVATSVCWNGGPASCFGPYPIKLSGCGGETHCVMSPSCGPTCALEDQPDPRCGSGQRFCDGGLLNTCTCDLVSARWDCGGADLCLEMNGESMCVDSSTPDPRCDPAERWVQSCVDDTTALICWYGFAKSIDCTPHHCDQKACIIVNGQ